MAIQDITRQCNLCQGSGELSDQLGGDMGACPDCTGTGRQITGELDGDLIDKLNDMEEKINDIFEKVNE